MFLLHTVASYCHGFAQVQLCFARAFPLVIWFFQKQRVPARFTVSIHSTNIRNCASGMLRKVFINFWFYHNRVLSQKQILLWALLSKILFSNYMWWGVNTGIWLIFCFCNIICSSRKKLSNILFLPLKNYPVFTVKTSKLIDTSDMIGIYCEKQTNCVKNYMDKVFR
jgi:hypothetical protein